MKRATQKRIRSKCSYDELVEQGYKYYCQIAKELRLNDRNYYLFYQALDTYNITPTAPKNKPASKMYSTSDIDKIKEYVESINKGW